MGLKIGKLCFDTFGSHLVSLVCLRSKLLMNFIISSYWLAICVLGTPRKSNKKYTALLVIGENYG